MKLRWKQLIALIFALTLMLTAAPLVTRANTAQALTENRYGTTTASGVNVRKEPAGSTLFQINAGTVFLITSVRSTSDGVSWVGVYIENPKKADEYVSGWIQGDFVRELNWAETITYEQDKYDGTISIALGVVKSGGVNLRVRPSIKATRLQYLDEGDIVMLLTIPNNSDLDAWYKVCKVSEVTSSTAADGVVGYVKKDYIRELSMGSLTPLPLLQSSPIPDSKKSTPVGHVKVLQSGLPACETPGGKIVTTSINRSTIMDCVGTTYSYSTQTTWYGVLWGSSKQLVYFDAAHVEPCNIAGMSKDYLSLDWDTETRDPIGYVRTTKNTVNIRENASTASNSLGQVAAAGTELPYYKTYTGSNGQTWYQVTYSGKEGWIVGSYLTVVSSTIPSVTTPGSSTETTPPASVTTPAVLPGTPKGKVTMTMKEVFIRRDPGSAGESLILVHDIETMDYYDVTTVGKTDWYYVQSSSGVVGWMSGKCLRLESSSVTTPPSSITTPPSSVTTPPAADTALGSVVMSMEKVYLRKSPSTKSESICLVNDIEVMDYYKTEQVGSTTWFYVKTASGKYGWMSGRCLYISSDPLTPPPSVTTPSGSETTPPSSVTTPPPAAEKGKVTMNITRVYLRTQPSTKAAHIALVEAIETMPYYATEQVGTITWYKVKTAAGDEGWMSGKCLYEGEPSVPTAPPSVTTPSGSETTPPSSVTTPPAAETTLPSALGKVGMTTTKVYLRKDPSLKGEVVTLVKSKETMDYYGSQTVNGVLWYYVKTVEGETGWMCGKYLNVVKPTTPPSSETTPPASETTPPAAVTTPPAVTTGYVQTTAKNVNVRSEPTTSANNVIKQISAKGTRLEYTTTTVVNGVTWYQVKISDKQSGWMMGTYLQVETPAAPTTAPVGGLYPAELVDWNDNVIQTLWANGEVYTIYDVKTGKTWKASKLYGSYHADIEPATAADTAVICEIYGVSDASQIKENTHYQRRPCLVTIGTRTFACSLYGVPHGEQKITNNNYDGQCCLHFLNSRIHGSGNIDPDHQAAIREAYDRCPAGKK